MEEGPVGLCIHGGRWTRACIMEKGPTEGGEDVPPVRLCMAKGLVRSCVHGGL